MIHLLTDERQPAVFDPAVLERLGRDLGDDRVAHRMVRRFVGLLPLRIERLEAALRDYDGHRALDVVLTIKVTAATVGGRDLHRAACEVEASVRSLELAQAVTRSAGLRRASKPLLRELSAYLREQD